MTGERGDLHAAAADPYRVASERGAVNVTGERMDDERARRQVMSNDEAAAYVADKIALRAALTAAEETVAAQALSLRASGVRVADLELELEDVRRELTTAETERDARFIALADCQEAHRAAVAAQVQALRERDDARKSRDNYRRYGVRVKRERDHWCNMAGYRAQERDDARAALAETTDVCNADLNCGVDCDCDDDAICLAHRILAAIPKASA